MALTLDTFRDILEPRRNEFSNFMWVSRELRNSIPYKHTSKIGPQQLKIEVLRSAKVQEIIRTLSEEEKLTSGVLEERVKKILDEIGYNKKLKVIRWLGLILAKITTRVCNGIHVNEESILHLKSQMGQAPVVYLPSHRTYADFILMSYVCFHYDIEIPAIAAGMDFHGMSGMGKVLRDTGAFFMRRSYNEDSLYWDTFREYVYQLVVKGNLGVEFFIEGTRSRTGKSLPPKFGLLTMVLKTFFNGEVPDILFVPINISYDRVMEERLFAFELLGVPKPKESTSALFKSLKLVNQRYGDVYVNFGSPISAHKFFDGKIERSVHNVQPKHIRTITEPERKIISVLAQEIVNCQQKLCVITTFNLISVILMNNLVNRSRKLTLEMLFEEVIWLNSVLEVLGAITDFSEKENIFISLQVHSNLVEVEAREVRLVQDDIVLDKFDASILKGHSLSEKTMNLAVPFVMLQLYVNPTLHYFINTALLIVIIKSSASSEMDKDKLFEDYCFLRSLFSKEFALFSNREKMEFGASIKQLKQLEVIKLDSAKIILEAENKINQLLCNLIQPFLFTYYIVCCTLKNVALNGCSENSILVASQCQIEVILNNNSTFIHPYSLSLDTISNCLLSLVELGAVSKIKRNNSVCYQLNVEPTASIETKLNDYLKQLVPKKLCDLFGLDIHLSSKM